MGDLALTSDGHSGSREDAVSFLPVVAAIGLATFTTWLYRFNKPAYVALSLHNISWTVAFTIVGSGIIRFDRMVPAAWIIIFSGIIAFNIGVLLGSGRSRLGPPPPSDTLTTPVFRLLIIFYSIGVAWYLLIIHRLYGVGVLLSDPIRIRSESIYLEALPLPAKVLFYLGPLLIIILLNPGLCPIRTTQVTRLALLIVLFFTQALTLQRTNLFIALIWQLAIIIHKRIQGSATSSNPFLSHRRRRKRMLLAAPLIVSSAIAAFILIGQHLGKNTAWEQTRDATTDWLDDSPFLPLAIYWSSGTVAFGQLTESSNHRWPPSDTENATVFGDYNPQTWGAASFASFFKAVPLTQPWEEVAPFVFVPVPTNVYTWYEPYYRDFRGPGVLLFSLITGYSVASLLRSGRGHPGRYLAATLAIALSAWAPFTNKYISTFFIQLVLCSILLIKARRPSLRQETACYYEHSPHHRGKDTVGRANAIIRHPHSHL
jgi:oligosaccharide repeat unit polymerase